MQVRFQFVSIFECFILCVVSPANIIFNCVSVCVKNYLYENIKKICFFQPFMAFELKSNMYNTNGAYAIVTYNNLFQTLSYKSQEL
jgi:hypothetical protein